MGLRIDTLEFLGWWDFFASLPKKPEIAPRALSLRLYHDVRGVNPGSNATDRSLSLRFHMAHPLTQLVLAGILLATPY